MARRKKTGVSVEREVPTPSLRTRARPVNLVALMRQVEDRRLFHPEGMNRPVRTFRGTRHRLVVAEPRRSIRRAVVRRPVVGEYLPWRVAFKQPRKVLVCVRRRMRRQVLHAFRLVGKGSGGGRKRISWLSGIRC